MGWIIFHPIFIAYTFSSNLACAVANLAIGILGAEQDT